MIGFLPAAASLLFGAAGAFGHGDVSVTLQNMDRDIQEHPQNYQERAERAWLVMINGLDRASMAEDIDSLLAQPAWRQHGLRLRAYHLHVQGRFQEAETRILENLAGTAFGLEQPRLLADIALRRGDTLAAIQAYRIGWQRAGSQEDYLFMLGLYDDLDSVPGALMEEGLRLYPHSPGVHRMVFEVYMKGDSGDVGKGLALSERAHTVLWPLSADWKILHAGALLAVRRRGEARSLLVEALTMLDEDIRLNADSEEAIRMRGEIFRLMERAGV